MSPRKLIFVDIQFWADLLQHAVLYARNPAVVIVFERKVPPTSPHTSNSADTRDLVRVSRGFLNKQTWKREQCSKVWLPVGAKAINQRLICMFENAAGEKSISTVRPSAVFHEKIEHTKFHTRSGRGSQYLTYLACGPHRASA